MKEEAIENGIKRLWKNKKKKTGRSAEKEPRLKKNQNDKTNPYFRQQDVKRGRNGNMKGGVRTIYEWEREGNGRRMGGGKDNTLKEDIKIEC